MKRNALGVMALALLAAVCMSNATIAVESGDSLSAKVGSGPLLKTMQISNQTDRTDTGQSILVLWNNFAENLNYSADVLNEINHLNLTNREAMVSFTTLLVLNSNAMTELEEISPGQEYEDFHGYTLNAMRHLNGYLGNMAKFYESGELRYAALALREFNQTIEYYKDGLEEAEFLF